MSKKSATEIIQEAISSLVAEAKGELMTIHIHDGEKKIGEVSPEDFRRHIGVKSAFLPDLVQQYNAHQEKTGSTHRASIHPVKKPVTKAHLTESDELENSILSFDETGTEMWAIPHKKDKRDSLGHALRWPSVGKVKGYKSPQISYFEKQEKEGNIKPHWTAYAHDRKGDGKVHHLGDFPSSKDAHHAIMKFHRDKSYN
jgi:hypothetical protein